MSQRQEWQYIPFKHANNMKITLKSFYTCITLLNDMMSPLPKYTDYKILNPFIVLHKT
jgi:hypothetical protein